MPLDTHIAHCLDNLKLLSKIVLYQWQICHQFACKNYSEDSLSLLEDNETIIDSLELSLREEIICGIVRYTPRAMALRQMISMLETTTYQERIGDLLHGVARHLAVMQQENFALKYFARELVEQLEDLREMIQKAIFAYSCADTNLAQQVIDCDETINQRHHSILQTIPEQLLTNPSTACTYIEALRLSDISYKLERVGDNATNIAEAAIFMAEGRNAKHPDIDKL